jgi:hypothetical protein
VLLRPSCTQLSCTCLTHVNVWERKANTSCVRGAGLNGMQGPIGPEGDTGPQGPRGVPGPHGPDIIACPGRLPPRAISVFVCRRCGAGARASRAK